MAATLHLPAVVFLRQTKTLELRTLFLCGAARISLYCRRLAGESSAFPIPTLTEDSLASLPASAPKRYVHAAGTQPKTEDQNGFTCLTAGRTCMPQPPFASADMEPYTIQNQDSLKLVRERAVGRARGRVRCGGQNPSQRELVRCR